MEEENIPIPEQLDDASVRRDRGEKAANIVHSVFGLAAGANPMNASAVGRDVIDNMLTNMFPAPETDWTHDPDRVSKAEAKRLRKQAKRVSVDSK